MRRLPIYLVLDTSGSMIGEPIEQVKYGLQMLVSALRQDPQALETAYLSVITFDSSARQLVPLTDLASFQPPEIKASGSTNMGDALKVVSECRDREVVKAGAGVQADWKPMVFLMTDGSPDSGWEKGLDIFQKQSWGIVVGCAVGAGNTAVLQKIAGESVVSLASTDSSAIAAFFKWVSASIIVGSQRVESSRKEVGGLNELPPPPPEINVVV
ncbi:vWA domain-containing protein [Singulisphaera sp. PoT]|uniref:vWA domain-containing protein n=1 Tax=Singulisphaera sp. PoT TaxID=3411797 RepID=UPI003BF58C04